MISVAEARNIVLEHTSILEKELIDITEALSRVSAEDIFSDTNIPPFDNSAMDGYAVASAALKGASNDNPALLTLEGELPAGYTTQKAVEGNKTIKIMTGAPIPDGADAVVPLEFTCQEGLKVKIFREAKKWDNIRFAGEDVRKGQLVIPARTTLGPSEIGVLAALNINNVNVIKLPEVSILSTGDELVGPAGELLPGKIRDINSYTLYAQVLKHGGQPRRLGIVKDTKEAIKARLKEAETCNIIIISGGVSVGQYDYVKDALGDLGMEEKFWKVAMKPGKPVLFGVVGQKLVFGLPGNPVSAMIAFDQFILPAIYKMQGKGEKPWRIIRAVTEEDLDKKTGFFHFIRGKTVLRDGIVHVKPVEQQSSGAISSMVSANCLIMMPENISQIRKGDKVSVQIIGNLGD